MVCYEVSIGRISCQASCTCTRQSLDQKILFSVRLGLTSAIIKSLLKMMRTALARPSNVAKASVHEMVL